MAVRVKHRRSQTSAEVPWIAVAARSRIQVFKILLIGILSFSWSATATDERAQAHNTCCGQHQIGKEVIPRVQCDI